MKSLIAACALLCCAGCINYDRNGTEHHVIIGFGIVSVSHTNKAVATVVKTQVLGLGVSDTAVSRVGLGYSSVTEVRVNTNENMLIEVYNLPGKPLTVNVPK